MFLSECELFEQPCRCHKKGWIIQFLQRWCLTFYKRSDPGKNINMNTIGLSNYSYQYLIACNEKSNWMYPSENSLHLYLIWSYIIFQDVYVDKMLFMSFTKLISNPSMFVSSNAKYLKLWACKIKCKVLSSKFVYHR